MGSFFTNIQIYTRKDQSITLQDAVDALKVWAGEKQYREAPKGKPADRTLALAPSANGKWITVYDGESEEQETEVMDELLTAISKQLQTTLIGVTVHDSDLLSMRMYENGSLIDYFSNEYMYWDREPTPEEKHSFDGDPEKWKPLLGENTPDALREAWDTEEVFVEDRLYKTAKLLDMEHKHCLTGYNYNHKAQYLTKLRYNYGTKRQPAYTIIKTGLPKLKLTVLFDSISSRVSNTEEDECIYQFILFNTGGPAKGLAVLVWGEAVDQGIVDVTNITAHKGKYNKESTSITTIDKLLDEENQIYYYAARFDDFEIPDGIVWNKIGKMNKKEIEKKISEDNITKVNVKISRIKPEDSKIHICFIPRGTPKDDRPHYTLPVNKDAMNPHEKALVEMDEYRRKATGGTF